MEMSEIVMLICLFISLGLCALGLAICLVILLVRLAIDIFKGEI